MIIARRRPGFSLIEALVALAVAAMTLTAIFELQQQMIRGQERAARAITQVMAQENALALTRDINFMERPTGDITLPEGDTIRWSAEPKGEPAVNTGFPVGNGQFQIQLYAVSVTIERAGGAPSPPLTFDRLGWRRLGVPSA